MRDFLQSDFLQALSYSLIASIWQMGLLWLAAITLLRLFRFSSAQKFNITFAAQIAGFALFVYTCIHAYSSGVEKIMLSKTAGNFIYNINSILRECMPYLATIYLCILLFKLTKLAFTYNTTKGFKSYGLKKISGDKRIFVQQMSELFSLSRKVSIYLSAKINCPLTIGFLKPVILIPVAAINHLTTEQMEAVILHELAHIKRADYLLFIIQSIIEKFFFFNIFSSMLGDIIERERENACDDWVLQFRYNSMHYAEALFKLGRLKAQPALAMQFSGKKESLLLIRIKRLLHNSQDKNNYNFQSVLSGFFSVLITIGLFVSLAVKPAGQKIITAKVNQVENKNDINKIASDKKTIPVQIDAVSIEKNRLAQIESVIDLGKATRQREVDKSEFDDAQSNLLALKQNYLMQVQQKLDSINNSLPKFKEALNARVIVTPQILQKAISYQNFKQMENMLAASGDSISIKETPSSKDSYQKEITIEAKDKNGNKHVYTVILQLYQ